MQVSENVDDTFKTPARQATITVRTRSDGRHIRLTTGIYSHVTMQEQTGAIESLPGPPVKKEEEHEADAA